MYWIQEDERTEHFREIVRKDYTLTIGDKRSKKMSSKSIFLMILFSAELIDAEGSIGKSVKDSDKFKGFTYHRSRSVLANEQLENLYDSLNWVIDHSEFQPVALSIGRFGPDSKILDRVTDHLRTRNLDHYQTDHEERLSMASHLQRGLTRIIIVDEFDDLHRHVENDTVLWNAASQYFVIYVGKRYDEPTNDWIDIFRTLWNRHRIFKILITSVHEDFRYLYRYSPFEMSNEEFGVVYRLDARGKSYCTATSNTEDIAESNRSAENCLAQESLFEDFLDLNGYPIDVTIFQSQMMNIVVDKKNQTKYTMLDAYVMKLVQKRMRSKFRIKVLDVHDEGDPFEKALDTIAPGGVSELVFTAYFTKQYLREFEFTASVLQDKLCLIAPSSERIPKCFMPFMPFTKDLWCLLMVYNLVVALLWSLIQRIDSALSGQHVVSTVGPVEIDIESWNRPPSGLIRSIRLLGFEDYPGVIRCGYFKRQRSSRASIDTNTEPSDEPPEINSCLVGSFDIFTVACYPLYGGKTATERAFLFGTLFVGLILMGLYQSCLVSSLSKPIFYPELNSLLAVAESNRTIVTKYKNLKDHTFPEGSPITDRLRKKIVISTSQEKTYDMVAYRGFVSLGRSSSFKLENLTEYYDDEGYKLLLHMVEECPATYALSYAARSFSPYLKRIDSLLLRMQQAGLIEKWYEDTLLRVKVQLSQSVPRRSDEGVKLTVEHLSLTFLGLGIGLFCSTLVFLGELHYARKLRCNGSFNSHLTSSHIQSPPSDSCSDVDASTDQCSIASLQC